MKTTPHPLAKKVLKLRGQKSFGLIAKELDVSRNVVAGICFRADYPVEVRLAVSGGFHNKLGIGHGNHYSCAPKHLPLLGRRPKKQAEATP